MAVGLRLVPEILAYPHPIGYDVVNYYIPVVTSLNEYWQYVYDDFPLYALTLYAISAITGLSAHSVVVGTAVAVFGLFSLSIYYLSTTLLKREAWQAIFITVFVIVQLAVLRMAWDLHRDLLALSIMFLIFGLVSVNRKGLMKFVLLAALCCLVVSMDRMVGLILLISLAAAATIRRNRAIAVLASISAVVFLSLQAPAFMSAQQDDANGDSTFKPQGQRPALDYAVLFGVLAGIIAVPAVLGFLRSKNVLLSAPFLVSAIGSTAWLVFQDPGFIVPERWTILFGLFASIYAGFFIVGVLARFRYQVIASTLILSCFAAMGIAFAVMPYDRPFILLALTKNNIQDFAPVTMQFNALDISDNDALVESIARINRATEDNAIIIGAKHWRGFMQMYLVDDREYRFSDNPEALGAALARLGKNVYLFEPTGDTSGFDFKRIEHSDRK